MPDKNDIIKSSWSILSIAKLFILFSCSEENSKSKKDKHPNIVFIMSDHNAYQAISVYSDELI